jgi:hypothetical protein
MRPAFAQVGSSSHQPYSFDQPFWGSQQWPIGLSFMVPYSYSGRGAGLLQQRVSHGLPSSASSASVSGPFSYSHSVRAFRPASSLSRCAAVYASQTLKVVPSAGAASSTALASSGGGMLSASHAEPQNYGSTGGRTVRGVAAAVHNAR